MSELVRNLLADRSSGVRSGADGHRFFRQRRVTFETIIMDAAELHGADWLEYREAVPLLNWDQSPSHRAIQSFARESSERFLSFWYRVFDVAIARAIFGRDTNILEVAFMRPTFFFDIGIPADVRHSSIPPGLHYKILSEYDAARSIPLSYRIYYLSNYLDGLTDDLIATLQPYQHLWQKRRERRQLQYEEFNRLYRASRAVLDAPVASESAEPETVLNDALEYLDAFLLQTLDALIERRAWNQLSSAVVRALIHRRRQGDLSVLKPGERQDILRNSPRGLFPESVYIFYATLRMPDEIYSGARRAASYSTAIFRSEMRLARLRYMHQRTGAELNAHGLLIKIKSYRKNLATLLKDTLEMRVLGRDYRQTARDCMRAMALWSCASHAWKLEAIRHWPAVPEPEHPSTDEIDCALQRAHAASESMFAFGSLLFHLSKNEQEILRMYQEYGDSNAADIETDQDDHAKKADAAHEPPLSGTTRYPGAERLDLSDIRIGNPFDEHVVVRRARDLIMRRLRPVRRTANFYSLIPGHRHGAMTLNPVMKLWKDRPAHNRHLPDIANLEINTRHTVECLLRLALLADPQLSQRALQRERIVREKRGREDLAVMNLFLVPGSCYPLREIHRVDFPDFRGRVIGEARTPTELGIERGEDAVLTGGWYQKFNHTLYYSVGGDNGQLIRTLWNSARSLSTPAFFFALGQFVHDCFAENYIYYRTGTQQTFRECIEDYYRMEDKVRKNRGEKMGRRKLDNSRPAVRFMFGVNYARLLMEALTGTSQSHFRHRATEDWLEHNVGLPLLNKSDRSRFMRIRRDARDIILAYNGQV